MKSMEIEGFIVQVIEAFLAKRRYIIHIIAKQLVL